MSLLRDVVGVLEAEGIPHALIGAAAMAVHGVARSTADMDLLTVDPRALRKPIWGALEARGVVARIMVGDQDDPLPEDARRLWKRLREEG